VVVPPLIALLKSKSTFNACDAPDKLLPQVFHDNQNFEDELAGVKVIAEFETSVNDAELSVVVAYCAVPPS